MNQQQAQNCIALADFLETLPAENYDHELFMISDPCGTMGCALGWAAAKGIGGLQLEDQTWPVYPGIESTSDAADFVFGDGAYNFIFCTCRPAADDEDEGEPTNERALSIHRLRLLASFSP